MKIIIIYWTKQLFYSKYKQITENKNISNSMQK